MGRFPARMGWVRIRRDQVKTELGRVKRSHPSHTPSRSKTKNADSTRLRGALAAPPSSPILDPLQIGGGIMTRNDLGI